MVRIMCASVGYFKLAARNFFLAVFFFVAPTLIFSESVDWRVAIPPSNFKEAKILLLQLYQENPFTFYCDCAFNRFGKVDKKTCAIHPQVTDDMLILEWEHIVPASLLGRSLPCWQADVCSIESVKNHRECCQRTSQQFQLREANLYNLVPDLRYSNRLRSNFKPGLIASKEKALRVCSLWVDRKKRMIEPDDRLKGFIARTYLKIAQVYDLQLTSHDKNLYILWSSSYPPTSWELRRDFLINQIYHFE